MEKEKKIILEGPDGSGKTTLANILRQKYPALDIADRSFISDRVYIQKFERTEYLGVDSKTYLSYWEQFHKNNLNVKVVLCIADEKVLYERCLAKNDPIVKDMSKDLAKLALIADMNLFINWSHEVCTRLNMPLLIVHTDKDIKDTLKEIEDFINDR